MIARIYELFPLLCPRCQKPLRFIAFLAAPDVDFGQRPPGWEENEVKIVAIDAAGNRTTTTRRLTR